MRRDLAADMTRDGFSAGIGAMLAAIVDALDQARGRRFPTRHIIVTDDETGSALRITERPAPSPQPYSIWCMRSGFASELIETGRRRPAPGVGDA